MCTWPERDGGKQMVARLRAGWKAWCLALVLGVVLGPGGAGEAGVVHGAPARQPNGTISGRVTGPGGGALAGVSISAGDYDTLLDCQGGGAYGTDSQPDGTYELEVPAGTYMVVVNSHGQPGAYVPQAYQDVDSWADIADASPVTVGAGEVVSGVDFSLAQGFTVSGRLVDDGGQPVLGAGGHIQNWTREVEFGCALGFGSSGTDGTFAVTVPAGLYELDFCAGSECHTVLRDLNVGGTLNLGDVLFAEAAYDPDPRALEPGYTAEWFVAPGAFNMPQEVLLAPNGDLLVLAVRSQTLYRVDASAAISTEASGLGAYLGDIDAAGNVYLYGHPGGIVYKLAPGGSTSVLAQSPALQVACDGGMGQGPDGNLYLAPNPCTAPSALMRLTPEGGLSQVASGMPNLIALRTAPDNRFLAASDDRVYELSLSDYSLSLVGSIPTCCISPGGMAFDPAGNIYLSTGARNASGRVYKLASGGGATLLAEVPDNGLSGIEWNPDTSEVVGGQLRQGGLLAVAADGTIRELVPGNGLVTPMGMACAPDGDLAVANDDGGMMARVTPQGQVDWYFDYVSFTPPMPFVTYAPDGALYAGEGAPGFVGRVVRLPAGGTAPGPYAAADWPGAVLYAPDGGVLVAETLAGRIVRLTAGGSRTVLASGLGFPQALALDGAGQLYAVVGSAGAHLDETFPVPMRGDTVVRLTPAGGAVSVTPAMDAAALVVAPGGDLFAAMGNWVARITPAGEITPFADGFHDAMGLAFDLAGNMYVSDQAANGIALICGFPAGTLRGTVRDEGGDPVAGARVKVVAGPPLVAGGVVTTSLDGTYELAVAPRAYTLSASGGEDGHARGSASVGVGETVTVDMVLQPWLSSYLPVILKDG